MVNDILRAKEEIGWTAAGHHPALVLNAGRSTSGTKGKPSDASDLVAQGGMRMEVTQKSTPRDRRHWSRLHRLKQQGNPVSRLGCATDELVPDLGFVLCSAT